MDLTGSSSGGFERGLDSNYGRFIRPEGRMTVLRNGGVSMRGKRRRKTIPRRTESVNRKRVHESCEGKEIS